MSSPHYPLKQGLYDPQFEKDSCGVGFVANMDGTRSNHIVRQALEVLSNLRHRGACGCDPESGDGAGIALQVPHEFLSEKCGEVGVELPAAGQYGVGMVFLPPNPEHRQFCEQMLERIIEEEGQRSLGWRDVPVDSSAIGRVAHEAEPVIRQIFIAKSPFLDAQQFERKLYVIRRRATTTIEASVMGDVGYFYIVSLSSRTLIYKGQLMARQMATFYLDLNDTSIKTALALVHSRFSTNTFPSWRLAHPFRYLAHNGEINTLRGNRNWMRARTATLASDVFGSDLKKLFPIVTETGSDSATLDNALEFLIQGGRSLPHAVMILVPEAWSKNIGMDADKKGFYEYHACLMEPWDGPAAVAFTDGVSIGAFLDRNGLRPARYLVTKSNLVVMASEVGVLDIPAEEVLYKGRLQPGKLFLVDTEQGRIVDDSELKACISRQKPYREWVEANKIDFGALPEPKQVPQTDPRALLQRQQFFGYTVEDLRILMAPMAKDGEEAIGSMGTDTPLAVLSNQSQLLYNYFKQLFAQVTNPPIDSIREEMVMSVESYIGSEGNLLAETPEHCRMLKLECPILTDFELAKIREISIGNFRAVTLSMTFSASQGEAGLEMSLQTLCQQASEAVASGASILILSDRAAGRDEVPMPSLLATSAVHHHLIREGTRTKAGLVVESGEAREVMHFALLIGYGAGAINPYLAFETMADMVQQNLFAAEVTVEKAYKNYVKSINKALLKIIAKMGISTIQSYRGAQIFEAIGLNTPLVEKYFTGTPSRVEGIGIEILARECLSRHCKAYPEERVNNPLLEVGGQYQWRREGEYHLFNPETVAKLQVAVRQDSFKTFREYSELINNQSKNLCTLRGLLKFRKGNPIPIEDVEPAKEIVRRFATGAMSFGSISKEAHENLAIAMNRIGGKSNTGEGGEDSARYQRDANGDWRRSAIKQVASARFGVTTEYLVNADDLQIKMAQGAKPGEGGQLPGHKVDKFIAKVRYSTPGVGLISPPPHHDIYSIEDLAQLISDLKNANSQARISVKLVAEVGVGTVAAGVAKAHADVVLISGHDGGTGASPLTSIKHAGIPWELGLAETQQVLVLNDLRGRIVVQTDGQLKTGRDVAIAALLGAEEFGFSSAPLVASGCIMMRKCHLNTCPVGVATQDPVLRKKFSGKPEHVINFFFYVAEELREIMAELGFRTLPNMVGHSEMLDMQDAIDHWKARGLDLSSILYKPDVPKRIATHCVTTQDHGLENVLDVQLIESCRGAIGHQAPVELYLPIHNTDRTVGAMLSGEIARRYGNEGLPEDTIRIKFTGSAGQSFGAFLAKGVTLTLEGDANDYVGKGLSGGRLVIYPPRNATFVPEDNILIGNTVLYGATGGEAYFRGVAGERFAVRNSGAHAVVEGVGDHGCEYMTGGVAVVLGKTGRNFAAGMSGGIAFVLDEEGVFPSLCNRSMVDLEPVVKLHDIDLLQALVENHRRLTDSTPAEYVLENWDDLLPKFVKVMPIDYRRVLEQMEREQAQAAQAQQELAAAQL
ncbi:MAG: glutamate synthase large subunit [Acidobacteria bacterium]|nr:glutamate synthase large subunit [Acidobacteriota bacterium]MCI0722708.1 glutamate synthase large subunit [Acidobacteriota bacterium]